MTAVWMGIVGQSLRRERWVVCYRSTWLGGFLSGPYLKSTLVRALSCLCSYNWQASQQTFLQRSGSWQVATRQYRQVFLMLLFSSHYNVLLGLPTSFKIPLASTFESSVFKPGAPNAFAVSIGLRLTAWPRYYHSKNTGSVAIQPRRENRTTRVRKR